MKFPVWYEQHQITILARVLEDKDMPSGKKLLIGNNHQLQRQTLIDLREMLYYTTTDDGTHIAIPCSAGEFKFQESSFHICAFEDINLPPESSQSVQITFQTTENEQTFDFPKPTLLLVENTKAQISTARGIIRAGGEFPTFVTVCNISQSPQVISKGEPITCASLCSEQVCLIQEDKYLITTLIIIIHPIILILILYLVFLLQIQTCLH